MRRFGRLALLCTVAALTSGIVEASVADYVGRPIAAVRLVFEGRDTSEPALADIVETRVGRSLSMVDVRESLTHLYSTGRFEDIRVDATLEGAGVVVRYELTPVHPVTSVEFAAFDAPGVSTSYLRRAIAERTTLRTSARGSNLRDAVSAALAARGYLSATVADRVAVFHDPDRSTVIVSIEPGPRAVVGALVVSGAPGVPADRFLGELGLSRGVPYESDALAERIERYVADRRSHGYYEARVQPTPTISEDRRTVDLTIAVNSGPRVRLAFAGDPLPADKRSELVPIEREGSVDEDLLEDSSRAIENYLRGEGYGDAAAPYTREESNGELVITFRVRRGPPFRVESYTVAENSSIPLAEFAPTLRVKVGGPFVAATLEADIATIEGVYRRAGFAAVKVNPDVNLQHANDASEVHVPINLIVHEGARTVVGDVRFTGNQTIAEARLRQLSAVRTGRPFLAAEVASSRDAIESEYANLGFQNVVVDARPEFGADAARADVTFTIREGPQIVVDHVLVVGNVRTKRETIERELRIRPGDPFGRQAISDGQTRLLALGLFRRVSIAELPHGEERRRDLLVLVEEAPLTTVATGGGVEGRRRVVSQEGSGVAEEQFELSPRASFEIGRRSVFGTNGSANLYTSVAAPLIRDAPSNTPVEYRVVGTFRLPRAIRAADLILNATTEQQIRSSFNLRRTSASAELARRLTREVSVSGSYSIQRSTVFDVNVSPEDQRLIDRTFTQVRLSSFSGSVIRDTRDDPVEPTRGEYFSANGQLAARAIGSEVGFFKTFFRATDVRTVPNTRRVVFVANSYLGMATGFPREDANGLPLVDPNTGEIARDLPQSERFYAGGDTTVRGFTLDTLGVRHTPPHPDDTIDKDGFPLGGNAVVIFNGELRLPAWRNAGVHGFVDTGNVFARVATIDLGALRTAVGTGVYYKSPIGPIRFDLGFKVNRQPGESLTAWFLTFGQAF